MKDKDSDKERPSAASFKVGAIALAFLIIGYQAALVIGRAARLRIEANRDQPDTVFVYLGDNSAVRELASPDVLLRRTPPTADGSGPLEARATGAPENLPIFGVVQPRVARAPEGTGIPAKGLSLA